MTHPSQIPGLLLSIGNPLLDGTILVDDNTLARFELTPGTTTMKSTQHQPIFDELLKDPNNVTFGAGGCAMNTARGYTWMVQSKGSACYVGTVGNDRSAHILKNVLDSEGVTQHFVTHPNLATGMCAVLVVDKERTMVTSLEAAKVFEESDFMRPEIYQSILNARVYFSTGFFFNVSPKTLIDIGLCSLTPGKRFLFNLAATFIIENCWEHILETLKYVDVVFCNNFEAEICGKMGGWGPDLNVIAEHLSSLPSAVGKLSRMAIITCGPEDTVVCYKKKLYHISPTPIPRDLLVDTNGAGDSFAGGFIAEFVNYGLKGVDLSEEQLLKCIDSAHYCARQVISVVGCNFVGLPEFNTKSYSEEEKLKVRVCEMKSEIVYNGEQVLVESL